jgi:hypothetical protein
MRVRRVGSSPATRVLGRARGGHETAVPRRRTRTSARSHERVECVRAVSSATAPARVLDARALHLRSAARSSREPTHNTPRLEQARCGAHFAEDKIVQMLAVMLLTPICESEFLECGYGFRPKRRPFTPNGRSRHHGADGRATRPCLPTSLPCCRRQWFHADRAATEWTRDRATTVSLDSVSCLVPQLQAAFRQLAEAGGENPGGRGQAAGHMSFQHVDFLTREARADEPDDVEGRAGERDAIPTERRTAI